MFSFYAIVLTAFLQPTDCSAFINAIEANPDSVIIAPKGVCVITDTVTPATNVRVLAEGTKIVGDFSHLTGSWPIFNVTGVSGFELHGASVHLGPNCRGVRGDSGTVDLLLKDVWFVGNLHQSTSYPNSSSMALWLTGAVGTRVIGGGITATWAGYYVVGSSSNTRISGTKINEVNFESIAVHGSDIVVSGNQIWGAGVGYPGFPLTGTGTNVAAGSTDVRVVGNHYQDGNTYGIRVYAATAEILGNTFTDNHSAGVYGYPGANVRIVGNTFTQGDSWGVALDSPTDSLVTGNRFVKEPMSLWVRDGDGAHLGGNTFVGSALPLYVGNQSQNTTEQDTTY